MLTVIDGYKLFTAPPSGHDYRFQAVPAPVIRGITAPFDPADDPPVMTNDMNEIVRITDFYDPTKDPTIDDCTLAAFSFRLLSDPQRVQTLSSAQNPNYGNTWFPTRNGSFVTSSVQSWAPIKYCVFTTAATAHIDADGGIFYTIGSPYVSILYEDSNHQQQFVRRNGDLLRNFDGMLMQPQGITQQEFLFSVSGGA